jgi:hypothetical protein
MMMFFDLPCMDALSGSQTIWSKWLNPEKQDDGSLFIMVSVKNG